MTGILGGVLQKWYKPWQPGMENQSQVGLQKDQFSINHLSNHNPWDTKIVLYITCIYIYICTYRVNICVYIYLLYIKLLYIYICIIAYRSVPWNQSKSMWFGNFQLSPIHRSTKINKHPGHALCTFLVATILVASLIHSASGGFSGDEIEHRITEKFRKKHTSWG